MLGDVGPDSVGVGVWLAAVDEAPVHDGDDEWVGDDCAPEEVVEGLEEAGEAV